MQINIACRLTKAVYLTSAEYLFNGLHPAATFCPYGGIIPLYLPRLNGSVLSAPCSP